MLVYQRVTYQVFFLWDANGDLMGFDEEHNMGSYGRVGSLGYLSGEIGRCCFDIELNCCCC